MSPLITYHPHPSSSPSQQGFPDVNPRVLNLNPIFYTYSWRDIEGIELTSCCLMTYLGEGYERRHEASDHREQSASSTGIDNASWLVCQK